MLSSRLPFAHWGLSAELRCFQRSEPRPGFLLWLSRGGDL
jgi:hypothetical protein